MKTNHSVRTFLSHESGSVLVASLLVMTLIATLMGGMFAALTADQKAQSIDRDQTQVYAAAHAGLEKLTSDLVTLFLTDVSPNMTEINSLMNFPPNIPGFTYVAPGGVNGSGYAINYEVLNGAPRARPGTINAGPYSGFEGLITPYDVTITARSTGGSEVRLRRELQTVAVPVFQFGVFSETDLTFYAGDDFDFGGRVHTNGNLYLSEAVGGTLRFTDKMTALGHVVRSHLANGRVVSDVGFTGSVMVPTTTGIPGVQRNLRYSPNEGSILGWPGTVPTPGNNPNWTTLSVGTYRNNIRTGTTGAKRLDLPIVSQGATPIDLLRRPATPNENATAPMIFGQRYYSLASLRILLSDRSADITGLAGISAGLPVPLDGSVGFAGLPVARSIGTHANFLTTNGSATTVVGGITYTDIRVQGNILPMFMHSNLRVWPNPAGPWMNVTCTIKTATEFRGCTLPNNILATGGTIQGTLPTSGLVVSAPLTLTAVAAGANRTLTLENNAGNPVPTGPFSVGLVWVGTNPSTRYTCEGYDTTLVPQRFTMCRGGGAPANNLPVGTGAHVNQNVSTIGGFIKIEQQRAGGVWADVTNEILNFGISAPNQSGNICADPTPNAILRIQRLRDNGGHRGSCWYGASTDAHNYWPLSLYDAREGNVRDVATNTLMEMGGVMQFITLDIANLKRWLDGTLAGVGNQTLNQNGYIVYFSDRRGNHNWNNPGGVDAPETGEYGWEDNVNPASNVGAANNVLDNGEDRNGNNTLDIYGATPQALVIPALDGHTNPFTIAQARPTTNISEAQAAVNRTVLFRRALKLVNGGINGGVNNLPTAGLTVVAENPVYVQGNYNATNTNTQAEPNVPAAIIADAVTVLSNNWNDQNSFTFPNDRAQRPAASTGYRFAVLAGKNPSFQYPTAGTPQFLFGTDGGVGNFLRLLENWNINGVSINYRGSIVSLFFSRQATGTFRFSPNVYSFGDRNFSFDTDFLNPTLLPPGTPMFRDVNTLSFRQILRPNQ